MPRKKGSRNSVNIPEPTPEPAPETNDENLEELEELEEPERRIKTFEDKTDPFKLLIESMNVRKEDSRDYSLKDIAKMFESSLKTLVNTQDGEILRNTDLEANNIPALAVMDSIGKYYHLRSVDLFLNRFYKMRISKDRKSRDEILQAVKILNQTISMDIIANSPNPMAMQAFGGFNNPQVTGNEALMKQKSRWKFWQR